MNGNKPTGKSVDRYVQYLIDTGHSASATHQSFWAIKAYFRYKGREDELVGISLPKILVKDPNCATPEEIQKLLDYKFTSLMEKTMIVLLYSCGLRVGELIQLRITDFDRENRTLSVRTKKKRMGSVIDRMPLEDVTYTVLDNYIKKLPAKHIYLFSFNGTDPINTRTVRYRLKQLCKGVGIKKLNPHSLRHAYGTQLAITGLSVEQIQAALRQNSPTSAERYMHMTAMDLKGKLPSLLSKKGNNE
jgi:site-specific recombinase XerD